MVEYTWEKCNLSPSCYKIKFTSNMYFEYNRCRFYVSILYGVSIEVTDQDYILQSLIRLISR